MANATSLSATPSRVEGGRTVKPIATESDHASGALLVLCLPLDLESPAEPVRATLPGEELAPFLPSMATATNYGDTRRAWAWSESTLVAARAVADPSSTRTIRFGHSYGTIKDVEPDERSDVPRRPGSCVALWHLPERGYVLTLESLRPQVTAEEIDQLAADLREGERWRLSWPGEHETPAEQVADRTLRDLASPLLGETPGAPMTLGSLLGDLPHGIPDVELHQLLVPRPFAPRGKRHFESLLVAIEAGATPTVTALHARSPVRDDLVERVQDEGYFWRWTTEDLVEQPVEEGAKIAVREDGRAAFLNLEAMSFCHDYLGVGGSTSVLDAIPLVAERASEDRDFWTATDAIGELSSSTSNDTLEDQVREIRAVRARISQRAALYDILHAPERFTTWTQGGQLSTLLRRAATQTDITVAGSPDDRSERALTVADKILSDLLYESAEQGRRFAEGERIRIDAERERQREEVAEERRLREEGDKARSEKEAAEQRRRAQERHDRLDREANVRRDREEQAHLIQSLGYAASLIGTVLAIVVLFTAIAAIPSEEGRAIDPLLRAAFITSAFGATVVAVAVLLAVALRWLRIRVKKDRRGTFGFGVSALAASSAGSIFGATRPEAVKPLGLLLLSTLAVGGAAAAIASLGLADPEDTPTTA